MNVVSGEISVDKSYNKALLNSTTCMTWLFCKSDIRHQHINFFGGVGGVAPRV